MARSTGASAHEAEKMLAQGLGAVEAVRCQLLELASTVRGESDRLQAVGQVRLERSELLRHLEGATAALARMGAMVEALVQGASKASSMLGCVADQWEGFQTRYKLGEQIIQAQEEERRHLAREIHDGPAQSMANVVLRAEICERLLAARRQEVAQELNQMKLLVRESLREVRKIIFDLRPMALDDLGLVPTLRRYLEHVNEQENVTVDLRVIGRERRLSSALEVALFRMVQEALNNALKHAQASRVSVTLTFTPDGVAAEVLDDGVGFDVEQMQRAWHDRHSFGLISMRERIELLDGDFQVTSEPGAGTRVAAWLPSR